MSSLKLSLLGPPRLERDGVPLELDTRKNIALIAYLAVTGESHSREALITLLWPELEPSRARAGLRRNLSVLKKALAGEWLVVDRETIGLDPNADPSAGSGQALWLDVDQFRSLLRACREHDHPEADVCPECLTALAEAVELYRGDFLAGFSLRDSLNFDEWQFFETESLALHWELQDKEGIAACLAGLAGVAEAEGQPERAARLLGAPEALLEASDTHLGAIGQAEYERIAAAVRAQLDEAAFAAAWAEGRARDLEATVAELLAELGESETSAEKSTQKRGYLYERDYTDGARTPNYQDPL
jgi:hypothetical protein